MNFKYRLDRWSLRLLTILGVAGLLLAACAAPPRMADASGSVSAVPTGPAAPTAAARLGTQWGEGVESRTTTVAATRVMPEQPDQVAFIDYGDAAALRRSMRNDVERQLNLQLVRGDIEWSVVDDTDRPMTLVRQRRGAGPFQLGGTEGGRYKMVFRNLSDRSYEIVATVDGLDVLNGQPGSLRNSGYVLRAHGALVIEGFRKNRDEVAAFRFAAPGRAYAANTEVGDVRNIGVLGAAVFRLNMPDTPKPARPADARPNPFPADAQPSTGNAPPPRYRN